MESVYHYYTLSFSLSAIIISHSLSLSLPLSLPPALSPRRTGDALEYSSTVKYYAVAMGLGPSLCDLLLPCSERLRLTKRLLENGADKGYSADVVLALMDY